MFNRDNDPLFVPMPCVNMPRRSRDYDPFESDDEDGANSNSDWQTSPETDDVPDTAIGRDHATTIADLPEGDRAPIAPLIEIARVIHASDFPRPLPRRRLPRRKGGMNAQQVALMGGLRQVAECDASLAANRLPFSVAHRVRYDIALHVLLRRTHPHAGKSLEAPLVMDAKGYTNIAPDLIHLLPQDPFDALDLAFCKSWVANTWHNDVGTSCLIGRQLWGGACALRREKECRLLRKRRPPSLVPDVFAREADMETLVTPSGHALVPAYDREPVPVLFPGVMEEDCVPAIDELMPDLRPVFPSDIDGAVDSLSPRLHELVLGCDDPLPLALTLTVMGVQRSAHFPNIWDMPTGPGEFGAEWAMHLPPGFSDEAWAQYAEYLFASARNVANADAVTKAIRIRTLPSSVQLDTAIAQGTTQSAMPTVFLTPDACAPLLPGPVEPSQTARYRSQCLGAANADLLATGVQGEDLPPRRAAAAMEAVATLDKEACHKRNIAKVMYAIWKAAGSASVSRVSYLAASAQLQEECSLLIWEPWTNSAYQYMRAGLAAWRRWVRFVRGRADHAPTRAPDR